MNQSNYVKKEFSLKCTSDSTPKRYTNSGTVVAMVYPLEALREDPEPQVLAKPVDGESRIQSGEAKHS